MTLLTFGIFLGDSELFSAAVSTSASEQSQGVYQEGSVLDNLQHHCREQSTNTGVLHILTD